MILDKCNCGRDARYMIGVEGSCNKRKVCPPYSQIEAELTQTKKELQELLEAANSLRFYREDTSYYKEAKNVVLRFESKYSL